MRRAAGTQAGLKAQGGRADVALRERQTSGPLAIRHRCLGPGQTRGRANEDDRGVVRRREESRAGETGGIDGAFHD